MRLELTITRLTRIDDTTTMFCGPIVSIPVVEPIGWGTDSKRIVEATKAPSVLDVVEFATLHLQITTDFAY